MNEKPKQLKPLTDLLPSFITGNVEKPRTSRPHAIHGGCKLHKTVEIIYTYPSYKDAKLDFERNYVEGILKHYKGNVSQAAKIAGKDRKDFYDLMKRIKVSPNTYR